MCSVIRSRSDVMRSHALCAEETDITRLYGVLLAELSRVGLAYIHLEASTDEDVLVGLREAWSGPLIVSPVFPLGPKQADKAAADHWLALGANLISFGRAFLANPDLVERLRQGLPISPHDQATWFAGGDSGYLTYPAYQHEG
jgi:N-ethylmaleimide reductase